MISIIIPVRNEEEIILEAIHQFDMLTLPHEIIVSDGGSTDTTLEKIKSTSARLVIHPPTKPQTISTNRNNGAEYAQGDILVFLDADTRIPDPHAFFTHIQNKFSTTKNLVGLIPLLYVYPKESKILDRIIYRNINFNFKVLNNILGRGAAMGKCQVIPCQIFKNIGGFREDLAASEDMDIFYRLSKMGRTLLDTHIHVFISVRRARAWGWPKLLYIWNRDALSYLFRNKVVSKQWTR